MKKFIDFAEGEVLKFPRHEYKHNKAHRHHGEMSDHHNEMARYHEDKGMEKSDDYEKSAKHFHSAGMHDVAAHLHDYARDMLHQHGHDSGEYQTAKERSAFMSKETLRNHKAYR